MRATFLGGAVLALLTGDCFAQTMLETNSGAAPNAYTRSQYKPPPPRPASRSDVSEAASANVTTSRITFHSRPSGARITLSDGKSCTAPCSFTVGFNEKFTAVATKRGYRSKQIEVAPSVTDRGKAQIIGSAIGAGVVGLIVGAAMADRAYGPEPFVIDLISDVTGSYAPASPVSPASASNAGVPRHAQTGSRPTPLTSEETAKIACTMQGCLEVKPGCRVIQQHNIASSSAGGGQGSLVVCN